MLLLSLILIPLLTGLICFFAGSRAPLVALFGATGSLVVACILYYYHNTGISPDQLHFEAKWIEDIGASFHIAIPNGISLLMVLLTSLAFPLVYLSIQNKKPERPAVFYGLMSLAQVGLIGVFIARDALLFYVFWEIALIPVYFLSSMYGGAGRIRVTFKFFVYTFAGSLLMLIALLYIYQQTSVGSFAWDVFVNTGNQLSLREQHLLFWLLFVAFAIKMPVFPFHTWQPDAYEQSATPVTIVLSALMVKMGLFAVITWLLPVLPDGCLRWMNLVMLLSVAGIIYASCLAMVQSNIKRLVAYSSIAHVGLMCAALFSHQVLGAQGAVLQMFNHGINVMGLWFLVHILEDRLQTQDMNRMGGIARVAPGFTIALVLISLANIALPLTNGFIGEFIMFNGLFNSVSPYRTAFTVAAGLGIILAAVYTLSMIRKVAYGETNELTAGFRDLSMNEWLVLTVIMLIILVLGFYPDLIMNLVTIN